MNEHSQTSGDPSPITLRPVVAADEPLLLEIYASTRAEEMAMVPWTSEQQDAFVKMQFTSQQEHYKKLQPDADHDIIMLNGRPVGRLYVARTNERIEIMDITVLPQHRKDDDSSIDRGPSIRETTTEGQKNARSGGGRNRTHRTV